MGLLHGFGSPRLWREFDPVLGLEFETRAVKKEDEAVEVPEEISALLAERQAARAGKDFARADALRAELSEKGWEIADTPQGATVKRKELGSEATCWRRRASS